MLFHVNSHEKVILEDKEFNNEVYKMTHFLNNQPLSPARMTHRDGHYTDLSKANL